MNLNPQLLKYVSQFAPDKIPLERRQLLKRISEDLYNDLSSRNQLDLVFICTHNSRRSHLGQIWAATAASYFGIEGVSTFSAGTEATAFNPRAVRALQKTGFTIESDSHETNPTYQVTHAEGIPPSMCFSKTIDHTTNPKDGFYALMTCSEADDDCPVIHGAKERYSLHYRDPKEADGTPAEISRYDERCLQIGNEMFYIFSQLKS